MKKKCLLFALIIVFLDQFIKYLVDKSFVLSGTKKIVGNFFSLTKTYNYGASWSLFSGMRLMLIVVTIIIFIFLLFYQKRFKATIWSIISFSFIYGGLIGNLIDRIFRGYVIDYIKLSFGNYTYPIFNLADIFLVIGFIILIIIEIKGDRNESHSR